MIKTELKFIVKNSTPKGPLDFNDGSSVTNPLYKYYTYSWSGNTMGDSSAIYPSLYNDGTLVSIPIISGWTWTIDSGNKAYMVSDYGSVEPIWQPLDGINTGEYYEVKFKIKGLTLSETITPYLYGNPGTTVTADGEYTQIIKVQGPLNIGDIYEGGVVFYTWSGGTEGLIAAQDDISTGTTWGQDFIIVSGTSTAIGTGNLNTNIAVSFESGYTGLVTSAPYICQNLSLSGYTDWYLPSKDELNQMWIQRYNISGFTSANYWTSSWFAGAGSQGAVWDQTFNGTGFQAGGLPSYPRRVRPIRSFKVPTSGNTLSFVPSVDAYAGITDISVSATLSKYRRVDLYDDEELNLTFQIQTNINDKGATYSKTTRLPGTSNNNILFNELLSDSVFIDLTTINDDNVIFLNKKLDAGIYDDSIELLTGYFELTRVIITNNKVEYEGTFYSSIKNIADAIGDLMLTGNANGGDIDLSQYDHLYNQSNIQSTWNGIGYNNSIGVYYPLIDYTTVENGNMLRLENLKPCIYAKEVWDKIFANVNYTYTSNFLNSSIFKSLVIPMGNKRRTTTYEYENTKFDIGMTNYQDTTMRFETNSTYNMNSPHYKINFDKTDGIYDNPNAIYDTVNHKWVVTGSAGKYTFKSTLIFGVKFVSDSGTAWESGYPNNGGSIRIWTWLSIKRGGVIYTPVKYSFHDYTIPRYRPEYGNHCWNSGDWCIEQESQIADFEDTYDVMTGDEIYIEMFIANPSFLPFQCTYSSIRSGTMTVRIAKYNASLNMVNTHFQMEPTNDQLNYYQIGETVYVNDALPEMKQLDFLSSICNKFCLMFTEDKTNSRNLIIEPYDSFYYSGVTNYIDWSRKIDLSKEKWTDRIPYLIDKDLSFQLTKDDGDKLLKNYYKSNNQTFGDRTIKNPYYSDSTETIKDNFAPTELVYFGDTNLIISRICGEKDQSLVPPESEVPVDSDYVVRFLYRKFLNGSGLPISGLSNVIVQHLVNGYYNTDWTFSSTSGYPYAGFLDNPYYPTLDLNYGNAESYYIEYPLSNQKNNLSWAYWRNKVSQYMNPNSKFITIYLKLNATDIAQLDFRKRVMLNNNLYKINRIIEWKLGGSSCKVELIQEASLNIDAYLTPTVWQSNPMLGLQKHDNNIILVEPKGDVDLGPQYSGVTITDYKLLTGFTYIDENNYIAKNSSNIIIGKGNLVNGISSIVRGDFNNITSDSNIVFNSHSNVVSSDNTLLINTSGITINTGLTHNILINSSNVTLTSTGKTYINNRDVDVLTDYNYVDGNFFNIANDVKLQPGKTLFADNITTLSGVTEKAAISDTFTLSGHTFTFINGLLMART